ncbi:phosphoglycerate mutase family protein isoform 1 [Galdieria sulphuraria]|nr:phosphoglycerate mutase family protein isoform 1 [Galdieria sulphuraria]EME28321.1 phosphoglycerate mutase family protein isoform 1 [Galdieria sulphuraria]|eukprot:XP_005704841.1 phosphoglycerate mutase family protein isoform 1 [Galdieria sulphuraria]
MDVLANSYYVLRHGESRANVEHLIVSDSENGILDSYGLTDKGKQQAQQAATHLKETLDKDWSEKYNKEMVTLVASPFSRARETAEIIATQLQFQVIVDPLLRER